MGKILFTHSYFLRFDPKQWRQQQAYAPLATIQAAALIRECGYETALFDTMFCRSADEISAKISSFKPDTVVIYDDGFNYLTKMCLTNMREAAWRMSELAKEAGCRVIISSSDSTDHYAKYLEKGCDVVIIGEGEETLKEVVAALYSNHDLKSIKGIAYLEDEATIKTGPRQVMRELDTLPLPAWDLVDFERYKQAWHISGSPFSVNLATTRGCPYKCNWCAKPIYGNRYNSRSPQHVVNEIKYIRSFTNFEHIWFCDDIFGLKPGWAEEFAELVQKEKLVFGFKIQSRADLLCEENTVIALKKAGCRQIWIGAESGSQKILDAMDKGITIQQIETSNKLMRKNGISPAFFLQFGYPGETWADIVKTFQMIEKLVPDEIGVSVSYPLPGTKFYESVKTELGEKANWTDSDELLLMFKNTFPAGFYKKLQRYIHYRLRRRQGMQFLGQMAKFKMPRQDWFKRALLLPYYLILNILDKRKLQKYVAAG